jgi:hypothetical protein
MSGREQIIGDTLRRIGERLQIAGNQSQGARRQPPLEGNAATHGLSLGKLSSLVSMKLERSGVAAVSIQNLLDKTPFLRFRTVTPAGSAGSNEGEAKSGSPETSFREIVRAPAAESPPHERPTQGNAASAGQSPAESSDPAANAEPHQIEASGHTNAGPLAAAQGSAAVQEAAASSADSPLPAFAQQVISPMVEVARSLANRETRALRVQLHPEKFGQIDLQITRGADGRMSAHMLTDLNVAHHALVKGIDGLREAPEQHGLTVDQLDVRMAPNSRGETGNHSSGHDDSRTASAANADRVSSGSSPGLEGQTMPPIEPRRLLNLRI